MVYIKFCVKAHAETRFTSNKFNIQEVQLIFTCMHQIPFKSTVEAYATNLRILRVSYNIVCFFLSDYAPHRTRDYSEAVRWYQKALDTDSCSDNDGGDSVFGSEVTPADPDHAILSRMAELYRSGGLGLEKDPQRSGDLYTEAAEAAMNAMKGKLANKFYMLAEEAWAEVPEEEET